MWQLFECLSSEKNEKYKLLSQENVSFFHYQVKKEERKNNHDQNKVNGISNLSVIQTKHFPFFHLLPQEIISYALLSKYYFEGKGSICSNMPLYKHTCPEGNFGSNAKRGTPATNENRIDDL